MQETHDNYFGSKVFHTTFRQAKSDKHEYHNVTATLYTWDDLVWQSNDPICLDTRNRGAKWMTIFALVYERDKHFIPFV